MAPVVSASYREELHGGSYSSSSSHPSTSSSYHDEPCHSNAYLALRSPDEEVGRIKCVFVGDAGVGKTSLIVSYTTNGYPHEYLPTAFDNYSVLVRVDNKPHRLQLCDTAGQAAQADARVILIGTQSDLRTNVRVLLDLSRYGETPVSEMEAREFAQEIGAEQYVECSALTQRNLKEVFDAAILVGLQSDESGESHQVFVQEVKGGMASKGIQALRDRLKRTNSLSGEARHGVRPKLSEPPTPFPLSPGLKRKMQPEEPPPWPPHRNLWSGRQSGYVSDGGQSQSAVMLRRQLSNTRLNEVKALPKSTHPPAKFSKLKKGWKAFMCLF